MTFCKFLSLVCISWISFVANTLISEIEYEAIVTYDMIYMTYDNEFMFLIKHLQFAKNI